MVLKPNMNLVSFSLGLKRLNKFYLRKTVLATDGIRGIGLSKSQKDFIKCHPNGVEGYSSIRSIAGFTIQKTRPDGEVTNYQLVKNDFTCNKTKCLVTCPRCPPRNICVHDYSCTCRQYAYGNFCKHLHILSLLESVETAIPNEDNSVDEINSNTSNSGEEVPAMEIATPACPSSDANQIEMPRQQSEENEEFLMLEQRFRQVNSKFKERLEQIEEIITSVNMSNDYKRSLVESLESAIEEIREVQNPTRFPRMDRKRSHPPLARTFFPSSKRKFSSKF